MKTVYLYMAIAAATAVLVGGIMLSSQDHSATSVLKVTQYKQNDLNQNPTQNVPGTPNPNGDKGTSENGFGDGDGD